MQIFGDTASLVKLLSERIALVIVFRRQVFVLLQMPLYGLFVICITILRVGIASRLDNGLLWSVLLVVKADSEYS